MSPLTFSRINMSGLFSWRILKISKNSVPRTSSKPRLYPAMLNGWHGNPAHKISCRGIDFAFNLVMSIGFCSSKFNEYVSHAFSSKSALKAHFSPCFSRPRRKPPMPAKRSMKSIELSIFRASVLHAGQYVLNYRHGKSVPYHFIPR